MNEALNLAYNDKLPIITFLSDWLINTYCIDMRNGNVLFFAKKDKNKFLKYCKDNLNNQIVTYIVANSNQITLQQNTIKI